MYFARPKYAVGFVKATKGPKFVQNGGQKYKTVNFRPFAAFRASATYLYRAKCIFVIVLLAQAFFGLFKDLQCPKSKIGLKIDEFVFLTSMLPKFWPFCSF